MLDPSDGIDYTRYVGNEFKHLFQAVLFGPVRAPVFVLGPI